MKQPPDENQLDRALLAQFSQFVCATIALDFGPDRFGDLQRGLRQASEEFGFSAPDDCARWLLSAPLSSDQIGTLAAHLTVGETYFLRDHGAFRLLREKIIPSMISAGQIGRRTLKIWSAACCTGEEAYSIAITLGQMSDGFDGWDVQILGTDINPRFLQRARTGIYGEWSFRGVEARVRRQFFTPIAGGRFEILPELRERVKFGFLNLAEDVYPSAANGTEGIDVIFCRNAMMYFSPAQLGMITVRLARCLNRGGYLIVGATETSPLLAAQLGVVNFDGITLYRKGSPEISPEILPPPEIFPTWPPPQPLPVLEFPTVVESLAPAQPPPAIAPPELDVPSTLERVRAMANAGELDAALDMCERALETEKLNPHLHYLRGSIFQEAGDWDLAAEAFGRVIYLLPEFVMAHISLANLSQLRGKTGETMRHRANALALINRHRPEDVVEGADGLTAARLSQILSTAARPVGGRS